MYCQDDADGCTKPLETIQVGSWPTDRNQVLIYLARHGGRLLEVGCGQGSVLTVLAPHFDRVVGIELSAVRAARAQQNLSHVSNCSVVHAPLEDLAQICDSPFDCIVWADVIEHIVDVIGAMRILASVSRVGAQLITVTPNAAYLPLRLRVLLGRALNTSLPTHRNDGFVYPPEQTVLLDGGHLHYFTFRQLDKLYRVAGFEPQRHLGFGGRFSRLRNIWPTMLSGAVCVSGIYRGKCT